MKTDKEYPATHSMWTAWFAVDLDGNVAVMECSDNGPAPTGVEDGNSANSLIEYSQQSDDEYAIAYTERQKALIEDKYLHLDDLKIDGFHGEYPFYFYGGSYESEEPLERLIIPEKGTNVKANQVSERLKGLIISFPVRFAEKPWLQIAEYVPCHTYYDSFVYVDDKPAYPFFTADDKSFFGFQDSDETPIELDVAFEHHNVKFDYDEPEYIINGKRGYFKGSGLDEKGQEWYWRVGEKYAITQDKIRTIEIYKIE